MQPGTKLATSIIGTTFGLLLVCGIVAVARYHSGKEANPQAVKTSPSAANATPAASGEGATFKSDYPYPECKACMRWFKTSVGEPDTITVLEWRLPKWQPKDARAITAKFRGRNSSGGWSVEKRSWVIVGGKVLSTRQLEYWEWPD
jgi:hypothetical protein